MKIIVSEGGPLVGLDRDFAHHWSGIWGKSFIGGAAPFSDDYEAAGDLTDGRGKPPCNIAKFSGTTADALLITMPFRTAVIESTGTSAYMAQVEYCEADWIFSSLQRSDFDKDKFNKDEEIQFSAKNCTYIFFDAAYSAEQVGDDFISFDLDAGDYVFCSAAYTPDELTGLILYKIAKIAKVA